MILVKEPDAGPRPRLCAHLPAPDGGGARRPASSAGIKVVVNAGGLNPARLRRGVARRWPRGSGSAPGSPTSRATTCCAALADAAGRGRRRCATSTRACRSPRCGSRWSPPTPTSAPGASPRRCDRGADVVIAGGSPTRRWSSGPAAWRFGWARDDWDALAGAVVAGHIIECGAQAPAATTPSSTRSPSSSAAGFPIAEMRATALRHHQASRHRRPGLGRHGHRPAPLRDRGPRYLNPDVTARFDTIAPRAGRAATACGSAASRGEPPPPTTKVVHQLPRRLQQLDDLRARRARHRGEGATWRRRRCGGARRPASVRRRTVPGRATTGRPRNDEAFALCGSRCKDPTERKVGPRVRQPPRSRWRWPSYPGLLHADGPPGAALALRRLLAGAGPRELVAPRVVIAASEAIDSRRLRTRRRAAPPGRAAPGAPRPERPPAAADRRARRSARSGGARSGDKGGNANVGVWARTPGAYAWLDGYLTASGWPS